MHLIQWAAAAADATHDRATDADAEPADDGVEEDKDADNDSSDDDDDVCGDRSVQSDLVQRAYCVYGTADLFLLHEMATLAVTLIVSLQVKCCFVNFKLFV